MKDQEAIDLMLGAANEIRNLRRYIEQLEPKAHAYDSISRILGLMPQPGQGYSEDVAWTLEKRVAQLQEALAGEAAGARHAEG